MRSMRTSLGAGTKLALSGLLVLGGLSALMARAEPAGGAAAPTADHKLIGATKCKSCHSSEETGNQYGKWQEEKHAKAFDTLASDRAKEIAKGKGIADAQKADECLKCHVTGHGMPADMLKGKWDDKMTALGVQCESCHGGGDDHMKARFAAAAKQEPGAKPEFKGVPADELTAVPPAATCKGCHNAESPTFKEFCYHKYTAMIRHPNPLREHEAGKPGCDDPCRCDGACTHKCGG